MTDIVKQHRLTEPMKELLLTTTSREQVAAGPVRAALMRRGLVYRFGTGSGLDCKLTPLGLQIRNQLFTDARP